MQHDQAGSPWARPSLLVPYGPQVPVCLASRVGADDALASTAIVCADDGGGGRVDGLAAAADAAAVAVSPCMELWRPNGLFLLSNPVLLLLLPLALVTLERPVGGSRRGIEEVRRTGETVKSPSPSLSPSSLP